MVKRRLRGDLIQAYLIMNGIDKVDVEHFFQLDDGCGYDLRGHSLKIKVKWSRLQLQQEFFSQRVVCAWNSLPASVAEASTVKHFQEEAGRLESCGFSKHRLLVHYIYKSQVTASLYCSKHDVTRICCWAPCTGAYAAEHRLLQHGARIDRYRLPANPSAANPPAAVAAVNQWNGRTDGRLTVT